MRALPRHIVSKPWKATVLAAGLAGFAAFAEAAPETSGTAVTGFKQAVAEAAWDNSAVAAFYRGNGYAPLWTEAGEAGAARRRALLAALGNAHLHGLPDQSGRAAQLLEQMRLARSVRDYGMVEAEMSRAFIDYATGLQTGILEPSAIDSGMVRKRQTPDRTAYLAGFRDSKPESYLRSLAPATAQYAALMKAKLRLEALVQSGGWGPAVPVRKMEPGDSGDHVIALRDRLIAMGFLTRSAARDYDAALENAVRRFQDAHGLETDGVAGKGTVTEINRTPEQRLKSVIVAMERERWLTPDRGERHILVNQTDFTAKIVDQGAVTFETRSVIGKNVHDRRSPEFSDLMEHMIINPSWHVPRSIITKEYLPQLQQNPHAQRQLEITDSRGRRVNRDAVDFSQFTAKTFPFAMRQPPSTRNALGLVKFMFPNKHNIYLHDTPQKHLFAREVRAYSHGCIRLAQPFEFAYALLAKQTENPKDFFHRILNTGKETKVDLDVKVPVHIIYRPAFVGEKGQPEYRRDIYGRDAKVWDALEAAGVALPGVQG